MSERKVKVTLSAQVQGYIKDMQEAARATQETGSAAERLAQQRAGMVELGQASMLMGAAAAAGVGLAVKKYADFDAAMSAVKAATHESEENMNLLGDAAMDAGARTVYSAEEAANAIEELAKAGVSTKDILAGGLNGALDLAAAGGLGVADAAGIAATAIQTFNLKGSDMSHVADLLAAGAGKAMGDVSDLSQALAQGGMVASQVGLSLDETTAALAAFASKGMLGSDAGTSLKTMLLALNPTSKEAADLMEQLNLSAYDQQGEFIGLAEYTGRLDAALGSMSAQQQSAALKTMFGNDAYRAAAVLLDEGEAGVRKWEAAVNDQGYAARMAADRLDNLKGDLEALGGALDTALIQTGSRANDALRSMVQWLGDVVDAYTMLPEPLQDAALGVGIVTAAVGLLGGGTLTAIVKIGEFKTAIDTLGITSSRASTALLGIGRFMIGPWGVALTAAAAVTGKLVGEKTKLLANAAELADTLDRETGAVTENTTAWAANKLEQEGILEHANRLGIDAKDMTDAWLGNASALGRVNKQLGEYEGTARLSSQALQKNKGWAEQRDAFKAISETLGGSNEMLSEAKAKHDRLAEATRESGDAADDASGKTAAEAEALASMGGEASDASAAVQELSDAIRNFGSGQFDVERSTIAFKDALAELQENLDSGEASLDLNAEAGRATGSALLDAAVKTNEYAASVAAMGGSAADVQAILDDGRQSIIDTRVALGESPEAAAEWADRFVSSADEVASALDAVNQAVEGIPSGKILKIDADTADAFEGIEGVQVAKIDGKTAYVYGDSKDAQKKIDAVIAKGIPGKSSYISAKDEAFWTAYQAIQQAQFKDKVVNIFETVRRTVENVADVASPHANGAIREYANGGISENVRAMNAYANGGSYATGIYKGGTPLIKFAEPETGWEALISGKPDQRDRNRQIWAETGDRLGMTDLLKALTSGQQQSSGVQIGSVQFSNPQQKQNYRDLYDTLKRLNRRGQ